MSHAATHWLATVPPDQMTHGEFRVLFHLCDCHNASMGCFPKQTYLREHTGLSNGGLNKALGQLEQKGLIRRETERDPRTNRQKPTRYILGFEISEAQKPTPLSGDGNTGTRLHSRGDGADSTFDAVPSPLSEGSVSTGVESYTKEEPVKEPVKEPCASEASAQTIDFVSFQDRFIELYPRLGSAEATERELRLALEAGTAPEAILWGARCYAIQQKDNQPRYIAYSENWLKDKRWESHPKPKSGEDAKAAVLKGRAKAILECQRWVPAHVSDHAARELIALGLVTEADCVAAGLRP